MKNISVRATGALTLAASRQTTLTWRHFSRSSKPPFHVAEPPALGQKISRFGISSVSGAETKVNLSCRRHLCSSSLHDGPAPHGSVTSSDSFVFWCGLLLLRAGWAPFSDVTCARRTRTGAFARRTRVAGLNQKRSFLVSQICRIISLWAGPSASLHHLMKATAITDSYVAFLRADSLLTLQ